MRWNDLPDLLGNIPLAQSNILLPPDLPIVVSAAPLIKTATTRLPLQVAMRPLTVATEVGMAAMHLLVGTGVIRPTHLRKTLAEASLAEGLLSNNSLFMRSSRLLPGRAGRGWALLCWPAVQV